MVKTKSIYDPESEEDGLRVLVTRYWPRGVKKDRAAVWLKELAPEPGLIKEWKSGSITWDEFRGRYEAGFASDKRKEALSELKRIVKEAGGDVTLLCACREEGQCHRKLLSAKL